MKCRNHNGSFQSQHNRFNTWLYRKIHCVIVTSYCSHRANLQTPLNYSSVITGLKLHRGHSLGAHVLALLPLSWPRCPFRFPIDFKICQWKCPLQNDNGLALSRMKFQALETNLYEVLKERYMFRNCQRPVFILGVSYH